DLNFKLGIAATVDYERAKKLRDVVAKIDEQGLLLESDAPDQPGVQHRGELNEPAFIVEHFKTMARLRATSEQHLAQVLRLNSMSLFKFPES
ncbi:MAG: TatD family deoxyribonuclease, partial [Aestuariibacter sp.]|nr:TatD family deoxyribonuclease [Aestuariibacter sp.]